MADPFSTALRVLLGAPGAVEAVYLAANGQTTPLSAIKNNEDAMLSLAGGSHAIGDGSTFVIAMADLPDRPRRGDFLSVAGADLSVLADGKSDAEGVSWIVQAG